MKQKDIALIVAVGVIGIILALIISNATIGSPSKHQQQAAVVNPINPNFNKPDSKYFNNNSIDPTPQPITTSPNPNPFKLSQQQ